MAHFRNVGAQEKSREPKDASRCRIRGGKKARQVTIATIRAAKTSLADGHNHDFTNSSSSAAKFADADLEWDRELGLPEHTAGYDCWIKGRGG